MRLLLDTHVLVWWLCQSRRLSRIAREHVTDSANVLYFSAASSFEIAVKQSLGKLDFPKPISSVLPKVFREQGITPLSVEHAHAFRVATLDLHHRDPFDRLLIAQAELEKLAIVTADRAFAPYGVKVVW